MVQGSGTRTERLSHHCEHFCLARWYNHSALHPMCAMPGIQSRCQFWFDACDEIWYRETCKQCFVLPVTTTTASSIDTNGITVAWLRENLAKVSGIVVNDQKKANLISLHKEQVQLGTLPAPSAAYLTSLNILRQSLQSIAMHAPSGNASSQSNER